MWQSSHCLNFFLPAVNIWCHCVPPAFALKIWSHGGLHPFCYWCSWSFCLFRKPREQTLSWWWWMTSELETWAAMAIQHLSKKDSLFCVFLTRSKIKKPVTPTHVLVHHQIKQNHFHLCSGGDGEGKYWQPNQRFVSRPLFKMWEKRKFVSGVNLNLTKMA